jgi:hypothetical protein
MCIVVEPLKKFHIVLKLAISHLINLNSFFDFQFLKQIIKNFQISAAVILVPCIKVKFMQLNTSHWMDRIKDLAKGDCIAAQLYFRVIALCDFINPGKQF